MSGLFCACGQALLDACTHKTLHKLALKQDEGHQQRGRCHQRGCGDGGPIHTLLHAGEHLQPHRQRARFHAVGDDERPQKVVPVKADRHQRKCGVHRPGQWHIHAPQNLQGAGAFHTRGLIELFGNAHESLAQQEDGKGRGKVRQANGQQRIHQAQLRHSFVVLDQQDIRHDHQLHQHQRKSHVLAAKRVARKGKSRQGGQHQLRRQDQQHQQAGVQKIAGKRRSVPGIAKVLQRPRRGQIKACGVGAGVKSRPYRVGQRQYPQQRQQPCGQRIQPCVAVNGGGGITVHKAWQSQSIQEKRPLPVRQHRQARQGLGDERWIAVSLVVHLFVQYKKLKQRHAGQHHHQHHGDGSGVRRIPELETHLIQVVEQQGGGVVWPAARQDEHVVYQSEGVDDRVDQHKQRGGHEQRPLHAAKEVPARSTFDGRRFFEAGVERLQRRQIEDHEKPSLFPHGHHGDGPQRGGWAAQPVVRRQAERAGELLQQPVLRGVEKQPDIGHGNHGQHRGREIRHTQPGTTGHALIHPQRHPQRQTDGGRNGDQRKPQIVAHGLPKHRVVHHDGVVLRPHPHRRARAARGGKEAVDQGGQRRPVGKCHQQHQRRQQQQPSVQATGADTAGRYRRRHDHPT